MSAPTNLSLNGIVTWAETNSSPGVAPAGQNINADRLDGYHAADILAAAQAMGGGGVVAMGSTTFAGSGGYKTITFSPTLPSATYAVYIVPDAATSSRVGEYWVTNKTTSSFRVYNAGTGATSFQWAVAVLGQMPDLAGPASGDLSGTHPGPYTVTRMQGRNISTSAPSTGQVLTWNGSSWAPAAAATPPSGGGDTASVYVVSGHGGNPPSITLPAGTWGGIGVGGNYTFAWPDISGTIGINMLGSAAWVTMFVRKS